MTLAEQLAQRTDSRILLVVLDGLGGLPRSGRTELEAAWTPHLDRLALSSELGLLIPVEPGITPGSGPAHLGLFGYEPQQFQVGRGVIEALGSGLEVGSDDLCGRANFCTIAPDGSIADRRAGRISTELCTELCRLLQSSIAEIDGVEVTIRPGKEHRFVVVFRGSGLGQGLTDSDPQHEGIPPLPVQAVDSSDNAASRSAAIVNSFIEKCRKVLGSRQQANGVLVRGLAKPPVIPSLQQRFGLNPACIASYPMYRGLARLVGMRVLPVGESWDEEVETLARHRSEHDFFFLHLKETDRAGEDGDFDAKQELIERFDEEILPRLLDMAFDVLCITGDHSTPAELGGHSWHPVPVLIHSSWCRPQQSVEQFGERACLRGTLGQMPARWLMNFLLAHARKLAKFGA